MIQQELQHKIINYLSQHNAERVGVFGSYARSENTKQSDLDLLVKFREPCSLLQLVRIENQLSEMLGVKVDLVTEGAVRNERLKEYIHQDIIYLLNNE